MNHFSPIIRNGPPVTGLLAATVTPFKGAWIDEGAFSSLVESQIEAGVDGIVTAGIAGEGPTLSEGERTRLVALAAEASGGKLPVIAASGSNATAQTIAWSLAARDAGANALLLTVPYYNRPSQEGILRHFAAVAEAVDLPILVQNAPERTGVELKPATLAELAASPGIAGIVGSLGCLAALQGISTIARLAAADSDMPTAYFAGGHGAISTVANLFPRLCRALHFAGCRGDLSQAQAIQDQIRPLLALLAEEQDPTLVKAAVARLRPGFNPKPRLPLLMPEQPWLLRLESLLPPLVAFEAALPRAGMPGERRDRATKDDDATNREPTKSEP